MFRAILMIWLGGVLCGSGAVREETITVATGDWPPEQRERITYNTRPLVVQTAHLLFPKSRADSQKYLALYNKGIELLKADGTMESYYDKMIMGWYSK